MRIINHHHTDIHFCLAMEEYFLTACEEDVAIVWQSHNAVVCGKHQVSLRESNYPYCLDHEITIARRISGGGTVFHDAGNLCFTFIRKVQGSQQQAIDFKQHTQPIVDLLRQLGVNAEHSGRNDIIADGFKISGNAEHLDQRRHKVLHHGTLLFNSDLENLGNAIRGNEQCYADKGVRSVRSKVANIQPKLSNRLSKDTFREVLVNHLQSTVAGSYRYTLQADDLASIAALRQEKFITPEWIFGYSPRYEFEQQTDCAAGTLHVVLRVEKGIVNEAVLRLNEVELVAASNALQGTFHHEPHWDDLSVLVPPGIGVAELKKVLY